MRYTASERIGLLRELTLHEQMNPVIGGTNHTVLDMVNRNL